jgi:3-hydroxyisobutyrate dehydrogenase
MSTMTHTIGVAGLGRMGRPMAQRLVDAGYQVSGFDPAGTETRLPSGAHAASSIEELASSSNIVLLSVPNGDVSVSICRELINASNRITSIVIDTSTIGITATRECAEILAGQEISYVDAPVSGGVAGATNGTLSMMVGASEQTFTEVEAILRVLSSKCFRVGDDPGHGQAMKLLNNYASAAALAATCEAAVFGTRMGLDLETIVEVVGASTGRSAAIEDKFPRSIVPRTYDFGFAAALMAKDISLYLENAEAAGVSHELAQATTDVWQRFFSAHPDADFTYIHKYFEDGGK